jgi:uncharacterized protein YkwD
VRLAGKTLAAAAVVAALASVSGGLAARSDGSATAAPRWHEGHRLAEDKGRLKRARTDVAPAPRRAASPELRLRWRAPFHVDSTEERPNDWRLGEPEPRPVQTRPQPAAEESPEPSPSSGYENTLLREINEVRRQHNLEALRVSKALTEAADFHSRAMAARGFFAHESADGSSFWKRVERFYPSRGFRYWSAGENLAYGSPTISPGWTVQAWMNSPGHRANLLSGTWQEVGLAAVHDDSAPGVYGGHRVTIVTADFGVRRS